MKKREKIYIALLKLRTDFIASQESIKKCIKYNDDTPISKSYYEGQDELLKCVINDITRLIQNIESGEVYEDSRLQ